MADILICGMEMPENCLFCPCSFWDQKTLALWCHALSTYDDNLVAENVTAIEVHCGKPTKAKRPEWCPLVELPEHGDLIDRDTALSHPFANGRYDHENANEHFIFGHESYKEWLEDLPVIVPASEEVADGREP